MQNDFPVGRVSWKPSRAFAVVAILASCNIGCGGGAVDGTSGDGGAGNVGGSENRGGAGGMGAPGGSGGVTGSPNGVVNDYSTADGGPAPESSCLGVGDECSNNIDCCGYPGVAACATDAGKKYCASFCDDNSECHSGCCRAIAGVVHRGLREQHRLLWLL